MADGILCEERGIPAAVVITDAFRKTAEAMAKTQGLEGYPYVAIPHPLSSLRAEEVWERAEAALPEVVRLLQEEVRG